MKKSNKKSGGKADGKKPKAAAKPYRKGTGRRKVVERVEPKRPPKEVCYTEKQTILICGEGDFSFTQSLFHHRGTLDGVVATSLDSKSAVLAKYPDAGICLNKIKGALIMHNVNATQLEKSLTPQLFDRIVFNFPHTGEQRVHLNRNLLRDFCKSAYNFVKSAPSGGEVHITLKNGPPYDGWEVKENAAKANLILIKTLAFDPNHFKGYHHQTTDPNAKPLDVRGCRVHVFGRAHNDLLDKGQIVAAPLKHYIVNTSSSAKKVRPIPPIKVNDDAHLEESESDALESQDEISDIET